MNREPRIDFGFTNEYSEMAKKSKKKKGGKAGSSAADRYVSDKVFSAANKFARMSDASDSCECTIS